jgi:hypothetical protein
MRMLGRTVRTFRNAVDSEQARWNDFRRTLRPHHRERLDRIFDYARKCGDAGTMIASARISEVVFISTMMEMLSEIDSLKQAISNLESQAEETNP